MVKKNRKKVVLCMFLIILTVCLGACQKEKKEEENAKKAEKSEETKKDVGEKEEYPAGTFDFEKACESLTIDGKRVGFPFTLDDLGEGYEFDPKFKTIEIPETNHYAARILRSDGKYMVVTVKDKFENLERTSEIIYASAQNDDFNMELAGITYVDSLEKIIEQLGEPTEKRPNPAAEYYEFWVYTGEGGYIDFAIKKDKIDAMRIGAK